MDRGAESTSSLGKGAVEQRSREHSWERPAGHDQPTLPRPSLGAAAALNVDTGVSVQHAVNPTLL